MMKECGVQTLDLDNLDGPACDKLEKKLAG